MMELEVFLRKFYRKNNFQVVGKYSHVYVRGRFGYLPEYEHVDSYYLRGQHKEPDVHNQIHADKNDLQS